MATKCFTCKESILNADFIKCEGLCAEKFHSKCAAMNKTMLNAVSSCPNIHWFCHDCNSGNKTINGSIDNLRSAVDVLTKSMSSDLLTGFKMLTDTLSTSLSAIHRSSLNFGIGTDVNSTKRRRTDMNDDLDLDEELGTSKKRFTTVKTFHMAVSSPPNSIRVRTSTSVGKASLFPMLTKEFRAII